MRKALKKVLGTTLVAGALVASIGGTAFAGNKHAGDAFPGQGNAYGFDKHFCSDPYWPC